jgi:uncharacterized protein (TIGR00255 family)
MKSMTGYGYGEKSTERFHISFEVKSYNNRYLDVYVNLPPPLSPLEPRIRACVASHVVRGKVEVYLKFKEIEEDLTVSVDPGVVRGYVKALKELASFADAPEDIRLSHLLRIEGILKSEKNRDVEEYWAAAEPLLREVLAGYEESRKKEGEATANDISRLLGTIEESLKEIEKLSPALESYFTDTIRTRMEELLRDQADEPRILSEVALLLVEYSVNE